METNRNETITIGTSAQVISVQKNKETNPRVELILVNTSTGGQNISLAIDAEATAGAGIVMYPGGNFERTVQGTILPTQAQITAIASGAGATMSLFERIGR